jgi:nicotinamidase-related amidase
MSLFPNTALLVIDVQQGLDDPALPRRNNPGAEKRIAELIAAWRTNGRPVIHVQHMSVEPKSTLRPELPGNAFKREAEPAAGEPVFQKTVSSAFIGTDLERHLRDNAITDLIVVGLTTEHCVSSTVRTAGNLGFNVIVVEDATAAFDTIGPDGKLYSGELMHRTALASLNEEFAVVKSTRKVLAEFGSSTP